MNTLKAILFSLILHALLTSSIYAGSDVTFRLIGSQNASAGMLSTDVQIAFEVLFNDILKKTGEKVEMSMFESFSKVESLFLNNEEYGGFYCSSVEFVQSDMVNIVDKEMLISSVFGTTASRKIFLVVNKVSDITTVNDLYEKDIVHGQSSDLIELYLNTIAIKNKNILYKDYFKTISNKLNGSESLVSLFFGHADVAAVYDDEYQHAIDLNPQLEKSLKIIGESPRLINAVVGVRKKGIEETQKNLFVHTALNLHNDKKGKKMLSMYGANKFELIKLDELASVKELLTTYNKHIKQ